MTGAAATLGVVLVGSLVVGHALLTLAEGRAAPGGRPQRWLAPAYGLAAMMLIAGVAGRLPGHGLTATLAIALSIAAALTYLRPGRAWAREVLLDAGPVIAITVIGASLPFAISGQVGILGTGLVNDDMASHLLIADYVRDPSGDIPVFIRGGYPTGPHSLVVAAAEGFGADLVDAFAGFTVALAALTGMLALSALGGLSRPRRIAVASLTGLSYLGAAYLSQGAFKEPLEAIILIAFALALARLLGMPLSAGDSPVAAKPIHSLFRVAPLGVLAAASVFNYSLPGILWIGAVGTLVVAARFLPPALAARRDGASIRQGLAAELPSGSGRRALPYLIAMAAVIVLFTAQEWSRIADFARLSALNPDRFGSDLGNLKQSLTPLEALGIWPSGEYRLTPSESGLPAIAFYLGGLIGAGALAHGIHRFWSSGRRALPAALVAVAAVWVFSSLFSTPYIAAKALAIAAPLVMLIAAGALLEPGGGRGRRALATLFVPLAAACSFLALRQAPVGPDDHASELSSLRPLVEGADVLFLGRDDFIAWELRGAAEITGIVENNYDVEELRGRFRKGEGGGEKFDFDAAYPSSLNRFDFVLATTGGPQSSPPTRYEPVKRTRSYVLYERSGDVGKRRTLEEGIEPGTVLDCSTPAGIEIGTGKGTATIWRTEPVIASEAGWRPGATVTDAATQTLKIARPGNYLISLAYDSRRPLAVSSPELGLETELPANLDFRGPTPYLPVAEVEVEVPGSYEVEVSVTRANLAARLLRAPNEAHLRALSATPLEVIDRIQRRESCNRYVDWYRPKRNPETGEP